jgi:hypothetical protein
MEQARLRRVALAISYPTLLLVCLGIWRLIGPKTLSTLAAQPLNLAPLPFLVFAAYEIVIISCHLARIFVAKPLGFQLLAFTCGPFAIRKLDGRRRFTWNNRETMLTGTTIFAPRHLDNLRGRCLLLNASAPLFVLALGLISLAVAWLADPIHSSIDLLFWTAMSFAGILTAVRLLLPFAHDRLADWGSLIWDAFQGKPTSEVLLLINALKYEGQQGVRPREWPQTWLNRAAVLTEKIDFPERFVVCFLCFYHAIDRRDIGTASRFLDEAVAKADPKSRALYARIMLESAFFEAWFRRSEFAARKAFDRVQDWSVVPRHTWLRASAALAAVEGRFDECHAQAREALEILQSLPVVHELAVEWLRELLQSGPVRC